jgi:hypothetical protein
VGVMSLIFGMQVTFEAQLAAQSQVVDW